MKYKDVKIYLDSFVNYEKNTQFAYTRELKLDRMRTLLERLGIDYSGLKFIHVAGTKGKGSTATFCASMLAACGYRVGLYTSPHFFDLRERIASYEPARRGTGTSSHRGGGVKISLISRSDVIGIIGQFQPVLDEMKRSAACGAPTFFEIYTALALRYFLKRKPDFVILETGLGGRLDATNVVTPLVSILTSIDFDHTQVLGKALSAIAREKAGIIKPNVPVVSARQRPGALRQIKTAARRSRSKLFLLGTDFSFDNVKLGREVSRFDFFLQGEKMTGLQMRMKGDCQIANASLALAALGVLKKEGVINGSAAFLQGLKVSFIPGRFEVIGNNPPVVLDVAHNPAAFCVLAKNLSDYYGDEKIVFIFGASRDKDVANMVGKIPYHKIIFTRSQNPRSMTCQEIREKTGITDACCTKDLRQALASALALIGKKKGTMILVAGSLFLVADAKRAISRMGVYG